MHFGYIQDMSYHGLFALLDIKPALQSTIKLSLSLSLLGGKTKDIYARVMSVRSMDTGYGCGLEYLNLDEISQSAIKEFVDQIIESH